MTISFIWHIHQPFFISGDEIKDRVAESYQNLVAIHEEFKIPFCLNITGVSLKRLLEVEPEFVEYIRKLTRDGLIELTASGYGHPLFALLPYERAKAHITEDINIKRKVFGATLNGFWPTDLCWVPWLIPLLKESKIEWIVIDSYGLLLSNSLPEWKSKEILGMKILSPEIRTITLRQEAHRPYIAELAGCKLFVFLRDHEVSEELVNLKSDILYNEKLINNYIKKVTDKRGFILIGNDCEKINAWNMRVYRKLVERLVENGVDFKTPSQYLKSNNVKTEERYFPANTFQYNLDPWISALDDKAYLLFMHNIYEKLGIAKFLAKLNNNKRIIELLKEAENVLLNAEDSGCIFWKFLSRARGPCYESAYKAMIYIRRALEALS